MYNPMDNSDKILRAAAYCRVSTRLEMQEGSYDMQVEYYRNMINSDPKLVLVGVYGDNGKSGMKMKSRDGFKQLMKDCKAGKIDIIYTKSVSRLARNMADFVTSINELKKLKIPVIFEKEHVSSMDARCELMLSIFSAIAQEESNSISQNMIAAHAQRAEEGRPLGSVAYGYYRTPDSVWHIEEKEARRVRYAFEQASEGRNYSEIRKGLNAIEEEEGTGVRWTQERLRRMLVNIVYVGDYYSHKTVCMTIGHQVRNNDFRDRLYLEGHHEAIVPHAVFDRVQAMVENRMLLTRRVLTREERAFMNDTSWKAEEGVV